MQSASFFSCLMALALLVGSTAGSAVAAGDTTTRLRILTTENPPLNFSRHGTITGLAAEVVRELIARTDTDADVEMVLLPDGYRGLGGEGDVALFSTVMTAEKKGRYQWVGPLVMMDTNLYALQGSDIEIANLDQARLTGTIATISNFYSERMLAEQNVSNLTSYPDRVSGVRALLNGEVRLMAASNTEMPATLRQAGASPEDVESVFTLSSDLVYIAFSSSTAPTVIERWQNELDAMKRDGTFAAIYARWLPSEAPPDSFQQVTEDYPPVTFLKAGKPSGLVTDIVREIAARQGIPDSIKLTSWTNAYTMALPNPNVVLLSKERTPEARDSFIGSAQSARTVRSFTQRREPVSEWPALMKPDKLGPLPPPRTGLPSSSSDARVSATCSAHRIRASMSSS